MLLGTTGKSKKIDLQYPLEAIKIDVLSTTQRLQIEDGHSKWSRNSQIELCKIKQTVFIFFFKIYRRMGCVRDVMTHLFNRSDSHARRTGFIFRCKTSVSISARLHNGGRLKDFIVSRNDLHVGDA